MGKYYLLRTERPHFSNASQNQEDLANSIEQNQREHLLKLIERKQDFQNLNNFDFIGELQGYPIGDKLYVANGNSELNIYYIETEFGRPWIIIGNANSETEFLTELNDDEDLLRLNPIGKAKQIRAIFLTENDINLSEIEIL